MKTYFDRYKELAETYKIAYGVTTFKDGQQIATNPDDYDVVVQCIGHGHAHTKYRVIKNGPGLSTKDLAIICDSGNLCFGYRSEGGVICVYTD